jgi:hypothetical protein
MPKFDLNALVTELQALGADAPKVLAALQAFLAAAQADMSKITPFLAKFFPSLNGVSAAVLADAKVAVDFLATWEPAVLSYMLTALALLAKFLPAA